VDQLVQDVHQDLFLHKEQDFVVKANQRVQVGPLVEFLEEVFEFLFVAFERERQVRIDPKGVVLVHFVEKNFV
jgi:hypothetical protein